MEYLHNCQTYVGGTGLAINSPLYRKKSIQIHFFPLTLLLIALSSYKLRDTNNDIFLIMEILESISTFTLLMIRKYVVFTHSSLMLDIFNDCYNLWSFDLFGLELEQKFKKQMKNCWTLAQTLITCGFITIMFMCVSALIEEEKLVPFICWLPDFLYARELIFLSQFIILMVVFYYILLTDGFYLLVCMDIKIQYKMMRKMLKSIKFGIILEKESLEKLVELAKHHNKMLKLHKKLNNVFSKYFLVQYAMSVSAITVQAYTLKYSEVTIETVLKSIFYTVSILLQVALYFFPASNVEIEASIIIIKLFILFFLNWQDYGNVKIRHHILFMLLKSQQKLEMKGGGMLHINRNEYLMMFRLALTIATLLGNLS
ncbi:uncharacterized protein LOC123005612 [Tribolium madens]|uniref:uncharacterized protein LOC123005612 n=1 Tax=Tribolium madens TaxID=41895 RepID=UPI001CF75436|nr:uncharacterized protein LOC123005612 [Tribolium madens]